MYGNEVSDLDQTNIRSDTGQFHHSLFQDRRLKRGGGDGGGAKYQVTKGG